MSDAAKKLGLITEVFTRALAKALEVQCQYRVTAGTPFAGKASVDPASRSTAIGAVLGLVGKEFNGTVAISYEEKLFLAILSTILGQPILAMGSELDDIAGEILNMVFGIAKAEIEQTMGYTFSSAIPTVIKGDRTRIRSMKGNIQISVPFTGRDGFLELRLSSGQ